MSQTQVTMRDVARTAGVHPGTVSRVLNPRTRPLVNPATADRVEQVAREMGYSLNPIARGLKTRRTFSVGVLIPDLTNPLFPPIIRGIERVLDAAGYTALVASTDGEPARERQRLEALIARQVDGFVIATAERRHPVVADAIASELAVVLVNRTIEGERRLRRRPRRPPRLGDGGRPPGGARPHPHRPHRRAAGDHHRPPALPRVRRGDGGRRPRRRPRA